MSKLTHRDDADIDAIELLGRGLPMKKLINQAFGLEPEPAWMTVIGAACAFIAPIVIVIAYVACSGL